MKIAVYTLTRDRHEYTVRSVTSLRERAGLPYDHYIVDNGSQDTTVDWLGRNEHLFKKVIYNSENFGISVGSNQALNEIFASKIKYSLVIKMDNDCEVISESILKTIVELYKVDPSMLLSPRVTGINNQPKREYYLEVGKYVIGRTGIVGGLFHILHAGIYRQYRYPATLPKAKGQDDDLCDWCYQRGTWIGYIEELSVAHIDGTEGQYQKYPEYFDRKFLEEKQT